MKIQNSRNNVEVANDAKYASGFLDQALGLLRKSNPRSLLFKTRFGIHTLFLAHPIDVLVLDNNYVVRHIKENLSPFSFYFWNPTYQYVLELPSGTIQKTNTRGGDTLIFDPPMQS